MKTVEDCVNTTRSFCDLTRVWKNIHEVYVIKVEGFRGSMLLVHCTKAFFPAMDSELISVSQLHPYCQDHHLLCHKIGRSAKVFETRG